MTYEIVKKNYDKKLWNKQMVAIAVVKNVITSEQYKTITGEEYVQPQSIPKSTQQAVAEHDEALNTLAGV